MVKGLEAPGQENAVSQIPRGLEEILPALRRLDDLLRAAVSLVQEAAAPATAGAPFRGLYIEQAEIAQLLARSPAESPFLPQLPRHRGLVASLDEDSGLGHLGRLFNLSTFDLDVLLVALAPELDLRYERLFGFLQDDVTRRAPTVEFVLNLLCYSVAEKSHARHCFAPEAPLFRHALLHLVADVNQTQPPLLAHYLKPDPRIVRWLLSEPGLDSRLASFCELIPASGKDDLQEEHSPIPSRLEALAREGTSLRLCFQGPRGAGKRAAARSLARRLGLAFLSADLRCASESRSELEPVPKLLIREALLQEALLYVSGLEASGGETQSDLWESFAALLRDFPRPAILGGTKPLPAALFRHSGLIVVSFPVASFAERRSTWQRLLANHGASLSCAEMDALAARFRFTPGQIAHSVASAQTRAVWNQADVCGESSTPFAAKPAFADLCAAARADCRPEFHRLAHRIEPRFDWDELILPADHKEQLREICKRIEFRHTVFDEWGFQHKLSLGRGITALFSGPPGTGKTMAAEVIAREIGLDLFKIDLSQVVSKYIGETEKNLDRAFTAAESSAAILFFDEADALFGKRSEVKDAHDRYANLEIGYLLQKMEEFEGVVILATNLRQHMDDAFLRRMQFVVEFPFPDEEHRRRIWQVAFPREAPVGPDVDLPFLAREIRLAGGNIRNIALAAAFYAADDGRVINRQHLVRASRREYQKLGRTWNEHGNAPEVRSLN